MPIRRKCYGSGISPETREYAPGEPFSHKKKGSILWAARMIDWKHPELVVKTAAYLKEHLKEIPFHITMIGGGELEEEVHSLAEELGVTDKITFAGFRSPEEVRAAMEESEIYLVTSDQEREGWGAVSTKPWNSGCSRRGGSYDRSGSLDDPTEEKRDPLSRRL